jgi:hypothetical protein
MPFVKGASGNTGGRPKGSKNKTGQSLRDSINNFLEGRFSHVETAFDQLKPFAKVKLYIDFLQYVLPKQTSNNNKIRFEDMTDEQLDEIVERLKNPNNE